ncbi:hypothetical protein OSB04_013883 [Centaurea solstitialis]|uniref:Uncharacterized protein n=1 Tax=Centaurea solstitialis TaxID=347529 RepID=A0AA38TFV5_9ASTR|nr:hypothetical protein OSB04_013883 [Centaurea solstitialis]
MPFELLGTLPQVMMSKLRHGLLPCLLRLLTNSHERSLQKETAKFDIKAEVASAISNATFGGYQ